ncbi:MAG TPA: outer membrane beta-barrel protein [Noviherbaspirillum sp.]|jgi:hypothetical protein|uniref:outer membrane protein n=1 Tax=Noviherbaspirillum sp. TaxID=1926288 RepID=UPI002DDCAAE1|nr:outer membrane beta-barrel protein [Noviherbaspirillum sp.]HEV2611351.1 outer membrane beta-barrel protein [Noviherbaspirillum sp.]
MHCRKAKTAIVIIAAGASVPFAPRIAFAENIFSIYPGTSHTRDSDLSINQPGRGTGITLRDVEWGADPFKPAPYYGLRLTHFFDASPSWGVALDFTHYKMYAKTGRAVRVDGILQGAPVNVVAPMDRYVQRFEISHGVNVLSVNGLYRWLDTGLAGGRLTPYIGGGLAYYRPHSENTVAGAYHETGYRSSGFGFQVLGGVGYQFTERVSAFLETKYNSGTAKVGVFQGEAETPLRSFHATAGISYRF